MPHVILQQRRYNERSETNFFIISKILESLVVETIVVNPHVVGENKAR
jgi:hypothetical protein